MVRSLIEYDSAVWDPSIVTISDSQMLEILQFKSLQFVSFIFKMDCPPHDNSPVQIAINLTFLSDKKQTVNLNSKENF